MANFLLEIGTEEIPARMIASAAEELTKRVRDLLAREHLAEAAGCGIFLHAAPHCGAGPWSGRAHSPISATR